MYVINTPGGPLTARADNLSLSFQLNRIQAGGVTLRDPKGMLLASAKEVVLNDAIPYVGPRAGIIRGSVNKVYALLERQRDGRFALENYLPSATKQPSQTPFSIDVRSVNVKIVDRSSPQVWQDWAVISRVKVDGIGANWIAGGTARLERTGTLTAEVRNDPVQGIAIDGNAANLDLTGILQHVATVPEANKLPVLRNIRAQQLVVSGPIQVFVPKTGTAAFQMKVTADGHDVSYLNRYTASTAHFEGILTHRGLAGKLTATDNGIQATYDGSLSWSKEIASGGAVTASIPNSNAAPSWVRQYLPNGVAASGARFTGWVSYAGRGAFRMDGSFQAGQASYKKESISAPHGTLSATESRVAIFLGGGQWQGTQVTGALQVGVTDKSLSGIAGAQKVPLPMLASKIGVKNLSGSASVEALIGGTFSKPTVEIRARGAAQTVAAGRHYNLGDVVAAGDLVGTTLVIQRLSVVGPSGVLTAKGSWNQPTNALALDIVGSGVPLTLLADNVKGSASFIGKVTGKATNPEAAGRIEVYDAQVDDQVLPLAVATIHANKTKVVADQVVALRGETQAKGSMSMTWKDQALSGNLSASNIPVKDYFGPDAVGAIQIPSATLGGTLKHVRLSGDFAGSYLIARGIAVDSVKGKITLDGSEANVTQATAMLDDGTVDASGKYDLQAKKGTLLATATGLDLGGLIPELSERASVRGTLNASISAAFGADGLESAKANGDVNDLMLNNVSIGSGPLEVNGTNGLFTGSATVGQLQRYLAINSFQYDSKQNLLSADIAGHNLPLEDAYAATSRYIASNQDPEDVQKKASVVLPASVTEKLAGLAGNVDAAVTLSGSAKQPDVDLQQLDISAIKLDGQPSGEIKALATRKDQVWTIPSLTWTGGPGQLSARGTVAEKGDIDIDGELNNVLSSALAVFDPNFSRLDAKADLSFNVSGPTKSPVVESSLHLETYNPTPTPVPVLPAGFVGPPVPQGIPSNAVALAQAAAQPRKPVHVDVLATIQDTGISAAGTYSYSGFTGPIVASIPFHWFEIPQDEPISAKISVPSRPIPELAPLFGFIDPKRTDGTISGAALISGTPSKLKVTGDLHAASTTFALNSMQSSLKNMTADLSFDGTSLALNANAQGSNGGTVSIKNANVKLDNLSDALSQSFDVLLRNPVGGEFQANDFHIIQKGTNNESVDTILNGALTLSGPLQRPLLTGNARVRGGSMTLPSEFPTSESPEAPTINPRFRIDLLAESPVTVKTGTGNFVVDGAGKLDGSLSSPDLGATLNLVSGTIRLPNARISLDEGGTVQIVYRATPYGSADAQANVELSGRTALTASPAGDIVQRYEVFLDIRGDLLAQNGLVIRATSNPPDLSSERILALLGQGELFAGRPLGTQAYSTNAQIQGALFTAVPVLLDPFTQQLANQLGLDYVSLDYNSFEQISITAAKTFGKYFVLTGRRQLSQPLPGRKQDYDFELSYRFPFKGKLFRNLDLSVGTDQDRPWKISLGYSFRF